MWGLPSSYDAWKTACCEKYPDCSNCPHDDDYDEDYEYNREQEIGDIKYDEMKGESLCD